MQFYDKQVGQAISVLNHARISMIDVSEEVRKKTFQLENQMAVAEKAGDVINYMALVAKWRNLFLACKPKSKPKENKKGEERPWETKKQRQKQSTLF